MAIKVITGPDKSAWPKEATCNSCGTVFEIGEPSDLEVSYDSQYNESYTTVKCRCPTCNAEVKFSKKDFTKYEISKMKRPYSGSYYDYR